MNTRARDVRTFDSLDALSEAAGDAIVRLARESVDARGRFSIALAGGNTPRATYELLATRHRDAIDWQRTLVVFGDERFVPADDARSNYKMAREALLSHVPIPPASILAVPTDLPTVDDAARQYDATLRQALGGQSSTAATVDLALLGVGPDGHTASLFPDAPEVLDRNHWALPVAAPTTVQPAVARVTTTLPFLEGARTVMFLVAGKDKRPVMREILDQSDAALRYPAALVAPHGPALWMIERSAMPDDRSNT